ncbi:MAG: hypothetical protein V3R89_03775, partial [Thermoanaerobaculia bacterium]
MFGRADPSALIRPGLLALLLAVPWSAPPAETAASEAPQLPFLLDLRGKLVGVRYTLGALDRAVRIQQRFEPLALDFGGWSRRPVSFAVLLLSREEWRA